MYGGYIVDHFDRLTSVTHLEFIMKDELLDEMILSASDTANADTTKVPSASLSYEGVMDHVENEFTMNSLSSVGLHPNAEIESCSKNSQLLLSNLLDLLFSSGIRDTNNTEKKANEQQLIDALLQDIVEFSREIILDRSNLVLIDDRGPFQNVLLLESERMNTLLEKIQSSAFTLNSAWRGQRRITDNMDILLTSLLADKVPQEWTSIAYPSLRPLGSWMRNLQTRVAQLSDWMATPGDEPAVFWISGFFYPSSLLTATQQVALQNRSFEPENLDTMTICTKKLRAEEVSQSAKEGIFISGLFLDGGSWSTQDSLLEESKPHQLYEALPIANIRAITHGPSHDSNFKCPVFLTRLRSLTHVFTVSMKSKHRNQKWIMEGVAVILDNT